MREWGSSAAGYLLVVQTWFLAVAVSRCHGRAVETTALLCSALLLCCSSVLLTTPVRFLLQHSGLLWAPPSFSLHVTPCSVTAVGKEMTSHFYQVNKKKKIKKTQIAHCTVPRIVNHTAGAIRSASLTPPPTEIFAGMNVCQSHKPKLRLLSKEEHLFRGTLRIRACLAGTAERAKSFRLECLISSAQPSDRFPM